MNKEKLALRRKSLIQIRSKKTSFKYFFVDTYTIDIVLTGTEIESICLGKASLAGALYYIYHDEIWIKGMNISPYFYGSYSDPGARRNRRLLLTKREIRKLEADLKAAGRTIVPILVFVDTYERTRVNIVLAKGKKEYDKRQTLKKKEDRQEMDKAIRNFWVQRRKMQCGVIAIFVADDPSRLADFHDEICSRVILQDKIGEVSVG